jgi:hypothetical protein
MTVPRLATRLCSRLPTAPGIRGTGVPLAPSRSRGRIGGAQFPPALALPIIVHATDADVTRSLRRTTTGNPAYDPAFQRARPARPRWPPCEASERASSRSERGLAGRPHAAPERGCVQVTRSQWCPCARSRPARRSGAAGRTICCLPGAVAPTDGKCVLRYAESTATAPVSPTSRRDGIDAIIKYTKFDVLRSDAGRRGARPTTRAQFLDARLRPNTSRRRLQAAARAGIQLQPVPIPDGLQRLTTTTASRLRRRLEQHDAREGLPSSSFTVRARSTAHRAPRRTSPSSSARVHRPSIARADGSECSTRRTFVVIVGRPVPRRRSGRG